MNRLIYIYQVLFQVFIVADVRVLSQHQLESPPNFKNPSYRVPPLFENYPPNSVNAPPLLLHYDPQLPNGPPTRDYVPPLFPQAPPFLPDPPQPPPNAPPPIISMAQPVPPNIPMHVQNELVPLPDPAPPLANDAPGQLNGHQLTFSGPPVRIQHPTSIASNETSLVSGIPVASLSPAPRIQDPVPQPSSLQIGPNVQGSPNQEQLIGAQSQQGQTQSAPRVQNELQSSDPALVNNQQILQPQVQPLVVDGRASSELPQAQQQQKQLVVQQHPAQQLQKTHQQLEQQQIQKQQAQQQQIPQQSNQQEQQIHQQPYQHQQPVYEYEQPELQQVSKFGTIPSSSYGASSSMYGQRPEYETVELETSTQKPQPMASAYAYQQQSLQNPQPVVTAYTYQQSSLPTMFSAYRFQPQSQHSSRPRPDTGNILKARLQQLQRMALYNKIFRPSVHAPPVSNADPRLQYFLHNQQVLSQQRRMLFDSMINYRAPQRVQYTSSASRPVNAYQAPPTFQGVPSSGSVREVYEMLSNGEMKCKNLYRIHNIDGMRHASSVCGQGLRCPAPYGREVQMGNSCMCCPYLDQATMTSLQQSPL